MRNVVIAGYARSPFTPAGRGELARVRPDEVAAQVVRRLVADGGVEPGDIEDLILGCAFPEGEQGLNVARLVVFLAGLPQSVGGVTVNRFCGSSMQAIHMAAGSIALGAGDVFVCAGIESMSRVPMAGFNPMPHPGLYESRPEAYISMGMTAENLARDSQISRRDQERFAVASQENAAVAQAAGRLAPEIVGIEQAREIFEGLLAARNPLGLMSEDTDPVTGTAWGNFPQTYSMVGLINGAVRLSKPWESTV